MATVDDLIAYEDKELLLSRVTQIVFEQGQAGFECRRCDRVLIRHYIATCGHKYCDNCKRLLLRSKSNCPLPDCKKIIEDMDQQSLDFERQLFNLRACCPNKGYGCKFISQLKDLGRHLRVCKETRENALPVEIIPDDQSLVAIGKLITNKFDKLSAELNKKFEDNKAEVDNKLEQILKIEREKNETEMDRKLRDMKLNIEISTLATIKMEKQMQVLKQEIAESNRKFKDTEAEVDNKFKIKNKESEEIIKNMEKQILLLKQEIEGSNKAMEENKAEMNKHFKDSKAEVDNKLEQILKIERENNETEKERKLRDMKLNVEISTLATIKETCKREMEGINKNMEQQMQLVKQEIKVNMSEVNSRIEKDTADKSIKISSLERLIEIRNPQLEEFTLAEDKCTIQPDFTWRISGIKEKLQQTTFKIKSQVFEWSGYPVTAEAQLELKRDSVAHMSMCLLELNRGKPMDINIIPKVYYVLKDQTENDDCFKNRIASSNYLFNSPFNNTLDFTATLAHKSWLNNQLHNVNNSVVIDIYIEPPSMAQHVHSYNGTLNYALDNYRRRKEFEKKTLVDYQESPYFYTGPRGYRVAVRMFLYGYGEYKGKGLTANIVFVTGEFDAELPLNFHHQTTVTIFDRKRTRVNIEKTVAQNINIEKEYYINICDEKEVEKYIENDTLFFKVTIKPK